MFVLNINLLFPAFNFSVFDETTLPFISTIDKVTVADVGKLNWMFATFVAGLGYTSIAILFLIIFLIDNGKIPFVYEAVSGLSKQNLVG